MIIDAYKKHLLAIFAPILLVLLNETEAIIEQIEATPRPSSGISLGDLSIPQTVLLFLVVLQSLILYSLGIFPIEFDLRGMNRIIPRIFTGKRSLSKRSIYVETDVMSSRKKVDYTTFLIDCPFQYLCDLDFWARKPHDSYFEKEIASWFNYTNTTWTNQDLTTYGGVGNCMEMYPCPYDPQEVFGIRIPGSRNKTISAHEHNDIDLHFGLIE